MTEEKVYHLINSIKVERAKRNLSQADLAFRVGVSRKTINTIETGRFIPSTLIALLIAREFAIPVEQIFNCKTKQRSLNKPTSLPGPAGTDFRFFVGMLEHYILLKVMRSFLL